ncbi:hypothetical protein AB0H57_10450 [Micromonospora sp. NPDC050686]|uniref:hypothetical protein n=1 Tax=Micromonospora sp. NPDC050686 TaxID=3154631 RepID=UPI0033CD90D9
MATPDDLAYIKDAFGSLCAPLHQAVETAAEVADAHFTEWGMTGSVYQRERTDLTRGHIRRILSGMDLGGWEIATERRNGQVLLRRALLRAKLLHIAPEHAVPPPGTNGARVAYYRNPDMDLYGVQASNLLALWHVDLETGEASVRVVRPTDIWKFTQNHKGDIDFLLPRADEDLMSLEFTPDDSAFELPFEIDIEEEGNGDAASW